ncbi:CaiB/BaiF CoA transferase family protein [Pseudooceanicola sp.]|uniref:CaiB/BaiF CoA transferase family protein n=1 Tax=Pseudooceanicola sp. TaxID=1914328 RepID=UPI004058D96B
MPKALEGITVVDFSHVVAGPLATHFLALNGARVIKIEPPAGDPLRDYTAQREQIGMSPAFRGINAGKDSVVLDLKTASGRAEALRLIRDADILVENFRPGVMARLGLDPDSLAAVNPALIYCSVSGFGQTGALREVAAIDQIVQALCGLMQLSGHEGDPALRVGFPVVDTFTGLLAAFAIQTALVQRERGLVRGQTIDVAMLDAALVMLLSVVNPLLMAGEAPARTGNRGFSRAPTADTFACADGEICVGAVQPEQVETLLAALDLSALLDDPAFADRIARIENAEAMHLHLAAAFARKPAAEWEVLLQAAGLPAARVRSVEEALDLPHLAERGLFLDAGGDRLLNAGFIFREGGPGTDRPAPALAK